MNVTINQNETTLEKGTTIKDLIESYGYEAYGEGLAVAINDQVIPKNQWDQYTLAEHDDVTLIQATQGG
jgi:sulfur carrier protein